MTSSTILISTFAGLAALYLLRLWTRKSFNIHLPPGPRGYPFIGSINNIPSHHAWLTYAEWKKQYGDILSFTVFGKTNIVLSSFKAATDLLDRRSSNFSSRPRLIMADELLGWDWDFAHMPYSDRWRKHRRVFHQYFQPRNLTIFYPVQKKLTVTLLDQLSKSPNEFIPHIQQYVASVVLQAAYGHEVQDENDSYISLVHAALKPLSPVLHATRSYLVEFLPLLKHVPVWMPGTAWKRRALAEAHRSENLRNVPFNIVKASMAAGVAKNSFVCDNLQKIQTENPSGPAEEEEIVKNCAGVVYLAGSDTTVCLLTSWVLAMVHYPDVQKRAQDEIDKVIGRARLPDITDMYLLPYVEAVILETMRWHPITPLGLPHKSLEDEVYEGYMIPAGSTITVNTWAILHDERLYPNPFQFNPERFLRDGSICFDSQPDPLSVGGFGFGRRICPGRYLAMNSARSAVTAILATYNISKAVDERGDIIEPLLKFTDGVISHPESYQVQITPRSEISAQLIESAKMTVSF